MLPTPVLVVLPGGSHVAAGALADAIANVAGAAAHRLPPGMMMYANAPLPAWCSCSGLLAFLISHVIQRAAMHEAFACLSSTDQRIMCNVPQMGPRLQRIDKYEWLVPGGAGLPTSLTELRLLHCPRCISMLTPQVRSWCCVTRGNAAILYSTHLQVIN
jgi:hypothetical protein